MTSGSDTPETAPKHQLLSQRLEKLTRDESGLNIIEIILIIFVAAVILLGLFMFFNDTVYNTVVEKINELLDIEITTR